MSPPTAPSSVPLASPDDVRALALTASLDEAAEALRDRLSPSVLPTLSPADALEWSLVAQEVAELDLAIRLLEHARSAPAASPALRRRVDTEWAALQEDLALASPSAAGSSPAGSSPAGSSPADLARDPYLEPTDAQLVRFTHLFGGREDTHARQWADSRGRKGGYSPVRGPITPALVRAHLAGTLTLGAYLLRVDGTVTFFVLDLDVRKRHLEDTAHHPARRQELLDRAAHAALGLRAQAASLGLPLLLEDSGFKGRHLWGLFATPLPAELVFRLGRALLTALAPRDPALHLEAFPKQARVREGGLGNLVKLPLGVHRRSGRRALLLDDAGRPLSDPWALLQAPPQISREAALDALATLRDRAPSPPPGAGPAPSPRVSPPPPPPDPADDPPLRRMLAGCAVVRALVTQGLITRRLTHDERVVLRHSLGHLPAGVRLVNDLFDRCPEIPPEDRLGRPMRGHPVSCARIRQRVPALTATLPCHCDLTLDPASYPTPLAYARGPFPRPALPHAAPVVEWSASPPPAAGPDPGPEAPPPPPGLPAPPSPAPAAPPPGPAWRGLAAALAVLPDHTLPMPGGSWVLDPTGAPRWTPAGAAAPPPPPTPHTKEP